MSPCVDLCSLVNNGETLKAIQYINQHFGHLDGNNPVIFRLYCQHFVELIRDGHHEGALRWSNEMMIPLAGHHEDLESFLTVRLYPQSCKLSSYVGGIRVAGIQEPAHVTRRPFAGTAAEVPAIPTAECLSFGRPDNHGPGDGGQTRHRDRQQAPNRAVKAALRAIAPINTNALLVGSSQVGHHQRV